MTRAAAGVLQQVSIWVSGIARQILEPPRVSQGVQQSCIPLFAGCCKSQHDLRNQQAAFYAAWPFVFGCLCCAHYAGLTNCEGVAAIGEAARSGANCSLSAGYMAEG